MARKTKAQLKKERQEEIIEWIMIPVLLALIILGLSRSGVVGTFLFNLQRYLFGSLFWLLTGGIIIVILANKFARRKEIEEKSVIAVFLIISCILLLCTFFYTEETGTDVAMKYIRDFRMYFTASAADMNVGGGIVGAILYVICSTLFGRTGVIVIAVLLFVIAMILLVPLEVYKNMFIAIANFFRVPEKEEKIIEPEEEKEPLNLWTMIDEQKEKKKSRQKLVDIKAEDGPDPVETTNLLTTVKENQEIPDNGPYLTKLINITADRDTEEIPIVSIPGKTISSSDSVFINVDDLEEDSEDMIDSTDHYSFHKQEDDALEEDIYSMENEDDSPETMSYYPLEEDDDYEDRMEAYDESVSYNEPVSYEELDEMHSMDTYDDADYCEAKTITPVDPIQPVSSAEVESVEQEPKVQVVEKLAPVERTEEKHVEPITKKVNADYRVPSRRIIYQLLDPLLDKNANSVNEVAAKERGKELIDILENFDIHAELIDTHIGPSVTQFEIRPDASVKVSKILSLADNIKMALAVKDVRIEAPIPGRNAVGIEVPNEQSTPVKMRELIDNTSEKDKKQPLLFYVGKNLLGQTVTCRLNRMPHLLIAGATGSGKSVCMNSIITSLLLRTHPDDVKMLLIDPKKVEFTPYRKIPHLIGPVINDPNQANNALKAIVQIMDERYNIFAASGVRNIEVFNQKVDEQGGRPNPDGSPAPKKMPYIVVIIDELADLMAVAGKEVEQSIQRIAQLARAAGIHMIVATQRPSVDVITGIIKANVPSRISFAVSSGTDSRTILDHVGAERLLGNGDMLYRAIGASSAERVQGVFVTDDEVQRITDWCSAHGTPEYDDKFVLLDAIDNGEFPNGIGVMDDPLYEKVREFVIDAQKASTSLLQRRFGIGYNRAANMIEALEQSGVIGPAQGSKPRDVYIKPDQASNRNETGGIY